MLVVAIISLHAMVYHKHQGDMTSEELSRENASATDFLDYLVLIFHHDTINSHDHYTFSEQNSFDSDFILDYWMPAALQTLPDKIIPAKTDRYSYLSNRILTTVFYFSNGLRAPPAFDF